jgi:hypothetical protein
MLANGGERNITGTKTLEKDKMVGEKEGMFGYETLSVLEEETMCRRGHGFEEGTNRTNGRAALIDRAAGLGVGLNREGCNPAGPEPADADAGSRDTEKTRGGPSRRYCYRQHAMQ